MDEKELQHFIFAPGPLTLKALEIFFELLRTHRTMRVSLHDVHRWASGDPFVSDLIPELIAEAVKVKR